MTVRVARAVALVAEVHGAGGTIRCDGAFLDLAARGPLPNELVERIRAAKPELLGLLAEPAEKADWRARHAEALAYHRVLHPAGEAAGIAWGEMVNRWHRLYSEKVAEWTCAGCGEPIGGLASLDLGDGNRVHLNEAHALDCLLAYGERWRGAATRALMAMGLQPRPITGARYEWPAIAFRLRPAARQAAPPPEPLARRDAPGSGDPRR